MITVAAETPVAKWEVRQVPGLTKQFQEYFFYQFIQMAYKKCVFQNAMNFLHTKMLLQKQLHLHNELT